MPGDKGRHHRTAVVQWWNRTSGIGCVWIKHMLRAVVSG
jgi:hypothetical protein